MCVPSMKHDYETQHYEKTHCGKSEESAVEELNWLTCKLKSTGAEQYLLAHQFLYLMIMLFAVVYTTIIFTFSCYCFQFLFPMSL